MVESWFRPATEGPRRFRASRCSIQGSAAEKPCSVQGEIDNATPKIELNTPLGHPTVRGRNMRYQDGCSEQRKRLNEILQRPRQSSRHSGQRRPSLIARTRRPDIAALQACSMRGQYDLYQPKDDAEGEHLEFKCHCVLMTIAR